MRFLAVLCLSLLISPLLWAGDSTPESHLEDGRSLYRAGHLDDAATAFAAAYEGAPADSEVRAAAALESAMVLWDQGLYEQARSRVQEAIDLARTLGLDDEIGQLLVTLGHVEASLGELREAEITLNLCVRMTAEAGDDVHGALCRLKRRAVLSLLGNDPGPESELRADLASLQGTQSPLTVATSLAKTADLLREQGDLSEARTFLDRAEAFYRDAGSIPALRRNQLRQVQLMHREGRFDEAAPRLARLREAFEGMRNRPLTMQSLMLQAQRAEHQGQGAQALELYRRALSVATEIESDLAAARVHLSICGLGSQAAVDHCEQARAAFSSAGMTPLYAQAAGAQGRIHHAAGDHERARRAYRAALSALDDLDADDETPARLARAMNGANLCQVESRMEATGALMTCDAALQALRALPHDHRDASASLTAATYRAAGRAAVREGHDSAQESFRQAITLYTESGELREAAQVALLSEDQELFREALAILEAADTPNDTDARAELRRLELSLRTQIAQGLLASEDWEPAQQALAALIEAATTPDDSDPRTAAWAHSALARAHLARGHRDDAIAALRQGLDLAREAGDDDLATSLQRNLDGLK